MRYLVPDWALDLGRGTSGLTRWVQQLAEPGVRDQQGMLTDVILADLVDDAARLWDDLDVAESYALAPSDASPGLVVGVVVEWTERLTPELAASAVLDLVDTAGAITAVEHVTTGLDEAIVVRRPRQLQAVIPEPGTGQALVLSWAAFGDVGWSVHEAAFEQLVASASSSATVDLAQR